MNRYASLARWTPAIWEFFRTKWWPFDMKIKVEEKGLWSRWYKKIQVKFPYFVCELTEYIS